MGVGAFSGPKPLAAWLSAHGCDTTRWGRAGAKSVDHLYTEMELGETELETFGSEGGEGGAAGVRRRVSVVKVCVTRPDAPEEVLVEAMQHFSDGTNRTRNRPLSEKMLPMELPLDAARRGVLEELGPLLKGDQSRVTVDPASLESWVEIQGSRSYPSLPTRYLLHSVSAVVEGVPAGPFTTLEMTAETAAAAHKSTLKSRQRRRPPKRGSRSAVAQALAPSEGADAAPLSVSGRPLLLPDQLLHVWDWVPSAQLLSGHSWQAGGGGVAARGDDDDDDDEPMDGAEAEEEEWVMFSEDAYDFDEAYADGAPEHLRAAAMSEDTGGCVMFVDPKGTYSIVCNGVDDLFDV